ncbi:hypothetical protein AGR4B_pAt20170 [Agrobacterium tumefaciens str. CFBP 5621]|nr:hypothetical protein AGR4B_pAt20170 [Agrobacterium tumefaciens str. CFBP 5621]
MRNSISIVALMFLVECVSVPSTESCTVTGSFLSETDRNGHKTWLTCITRALDVVIFLTLHSTGKACGMSPSICEQVAVIWNGCHKRR